MTNEEKKAVETIKDLKEIKWYEHAFDKGTEILSEEEKQDIDVILNLLEKQDNRIKELESDKEIKDKTIKLIKNRIFLTVHECEEIKEIENRSVSKSWEDSVIEYFENLAKESGDENVSRSN